MLNVLVNRRWNQARSTLSEVRLVETDYGPPNLGGRPDFFVLEDGETPNPYGLKVPGETRIPAGTYVLGLRTDSPIGQRKAERWPWFKYGMIWLQDVPGFQWIYFHEGNTHRDTLGCLILGLSARVPLDKQEDVEVAQSVLALKRFYSAVGPRLQAGELVTTTITDGGF